MVLFIFEQWSYIVCIFLWLALSVVHYVKRFIPAECGSLCFTNACSCALIAYCMNMPQFLYLFPCWWTFVSIFIAKTKKCCFMHSCLSLFSYPYVQEFLLLIFSGMYLLRHRVYAFLPKYLSQIAPVVTHLHQKLVIADFFLFIKLKYN